MEPINGSDRSLQMPLAVFVIQESLEEVLPRLDHMTGGVDLLLLDGDVVHRLLLHIIVADHLPPTMGGTVEVLAVAETGAEVAVVGGVLEETNPGFSSIVGKKNVPGSKIAGEIV